MVRQATAEDLEGINTIENWAVENIFGHFGISAVELSATCGAFDAARGIYPWFVADRDGKVIGFARAAAWKAREAYRRSTEIGIYVAPEHHGQGIGRSLYAELFGELERMDFHTVIAGITLPNPASVRLHESFGMTRIGTFPEVGFKFGEWRSVGYWCRVLGS
ncbi:MAG TPA: GNAT family N-acetyltransferase [Fimbriimonadaceae bacterium]|nr:GNAT family N-acetyltransferase [Fimbriimonadaceae bacterium]